MDLNSPISLTILCPNCKKEILTNSNFCQFCGYVLHENLGFGKKLYIYCLSIFLPPLGLIWFFKYFKSEKYKRVAYLALILTIIASFCAIWWTIDFMQNFQKSLVKYSNLGY